MHGIIYLKRDRHTSRGRLEPCDRVYLCSKKHVYCTCIPRCENAPSSTASGTLVASVAEATIFIASLGIWRRNFLTLRRERPFACVRARIDNARERKQNAEDFKALGIVKLVKLERAFSSFRTSNCRSGFSSPCLLG